MHNKKGQVGDTLTWIVATVIIITIMLFFVFGSSALESTKKVSIYQEKVIGSANNLLSEELEEDIFLKKSIYSYFRLDSGKKDKVERALKEMDEGGDFSLDFEEEKKKIEKRLK